MIPACAFGKNVKQRLYILYCVSAAKGVGFGGMCAAAGQPTPWNTPQIRINYGAKLYNDMICHQI